MDDLYHIPVMSEKVFEGLIVLPGELYVDCTLGGGGHAEAILEHDARLIAMDRDPEAVTYATERLRGYGDAVEIHHALFSQIGDVVGSRMGSVAGVLFDLGVSSRMLDNPSRGFSYRHDAPLRMTMGLTGKNAQDVVNTADVAELERIFRLYGEEPLARRIAHAITRMRSERPVTLTLELAGLVERVAGPKKPQKTKARVFQALRIYVNDELKELEHGLEDSCSVLRPGGRLCVISYHSLEDRVVKDFIRRHTDPCICPPGLPFCSCGKKADLKPVTKKPLVPTPQEVECNSRAQSARLRIAEKLETV